MSCWTKASSWHRTTKKRGPIFLGTTGLFIHWVTANSLMDALSSSVPDAVCTWQSWRGEFTSRARLTDSKWPLNWNSTRPNLNGNWVIRAQKIKPETTWIWPRPPLEDWMKTGWFNSSILFVVSKDYILESSNCSSSTDSYSFLTAASQLPNNDNDIQQLLEKAVKCDSYRFVTLFSRSNYIQLAYCQICRTTGTVVNWTTKCLPESSAYLAKELIYSWKMRLPN